MFLELQVRLQNHVADAIRRVREDQEGQTFVEWLGVMAIIVAIVTGLLAGGILDSVVNAIRDTAKKAIDAIGDEI